MELRRSGFPIVMVILGEKIGVDMMSVDEQRGANIAVRRLIDLGHRRIGTIDDSNPEGYRQKLEGCTQALADAILPSITPGR